jgi:hypothetical protein
VWAVVGKTVPAKQNLFSNLQAMIGRQLTSLVSARLLTYPAVALVGPRQSGKTTPHRFSRTSFRPSSSRAKATAPKIRPNRRPESFASTVQSCTLKPSAKPAGFFEPNNGQF